MTDDIDHSFLIEITYPFVKETLTVYDEEGPHERTSWRPGTRVEPVYPDDAEMVADGMGFQIITMIGEYSPPRFPKRIFFTVKWRDPRGHEFGKNRLRITTAGAFRTRCRGFRHEFKLLKEAE